MTSSTHDESVSDPVRSHAPPQPEAGIDERITAGPDAIQEVQKAQPRVAWPWLTGFLSLLLGRQLGELTGYLGACMVGAQAPGATPHVAALVKAHEIGPHAGALFAAIAGYIAARAFGSRGFNPFAGLLLGVIIGGIAAAIAGLLAGCF